MIIIEKPPSQTQQYNNNYNNGKPRKTDELSFPTSYTVQEIYTFIFFLDWFSFPSIIHFIHFVTLIGKLFLLKMNLKKKFIYICVLL